jgi:hypothetical protein
VSLLDELEAEREKHDEGAYDDMKAAKDKAEADLAAARAALKAKRGDAPRGGADTSVTVQMAGEDRHIPNIPALREAVAKYEAWKQNDDAGFNELIDLCDALPTLLDELETLRDNDVRGMCIIEAAIRSPSIAHYMSHWEGRCLKAEADLDRLATDYTDLGELLFGEAEYEHGDVRPRVVSILDELEALKARTCATCRHQGAWEDGTLVCHEWSDNDGWSAKCADILTCGAWAAQEQL